MPQPNVVFVIADQHRWDFMGHGANGATHTPTLDEMGAQGAVFRRAYTTAPLCSPAREAIHCGRYGMNSGCFTNLHELPPGAPSFVQQFRQAGYRTCAVGKTHMEIHAYDSDLCSDEHLAFMDSLGWDEAYEISGNGMMKTGINCAYVEFLEERGKFADVLRYYEHWTYFMDKEVKGDSPWTPHEFPLDEELQETAFVGNRAVEWLQQRDRSQPFLLHVGFAGPHSPIEPFPAYMDLYRDAEETMPWGVDAPNPARLAARRGYRAMVTQIDAYVGRLRACLAEQGELENTVFVYTADHGEMAGDHGRTGKTCFFDGSVRVPFIVAGPGVKPGVDTDALVEVIDVGKTLCELAGVEPHALDQGKGLARVLSGEADSHRDTVYSEMGCDRMLFDGRHKLMRGDPKLDTRKLGRLHLDKPVDVPASPCRLYDTETDPHELNDLASAPGHRDTLTMMQAKLLDRINENTQMQPFKSRGEYVPVRSWEVAATGRRRESNA